MFKGMLTSEDVVVDILKYDDAFEFIAALNPAPTCQVVSALFSVTI